MGVNIANKVISTDEIVCNGTFQVTLALSASPDVISDPVDIVLVLDRSGSMAGVPLANMKLGAKAFVEVIAHATGGTDTIEGGSRIAVTSFSDTAVVNQVLTASVAALDAAIDILVAGGSTNHADAFTRAVNTFDPGSQNRKVMIMFTDGETTAGGNPDPIAAAAKAAGIVIYMIGLVGEDGIDVAKLNLWASDPDASHVLVSPDVADLEELFKNLANNITKPGATDIVIDELLTSDFQLVCVNSPSKGTVMQTGPSSLQWKIDKLGVSGNEGASLTFTVKHVGNTGGNMKVNQSVTYTDQEGSIVTFPDPRIQVDCGLKRCIECVGPRSEAVIEGCKDSIIYDLGDVDLDSTGRIAQVRLTLKNVCPGKRVALAILLNEVDILGHEIKRGMKTMTVPAHNSPTCRDIELRCIRFVLPEDDGTIPCHSTPICGRRVFVAKTVAHYIDYDFEWEEEVSTIF